MSCLELNGQRSIGGAKNGSAWRIDRSALPVTCELLYRGLKRPLFVQRVRLSVHMVRVCLLLFLLFMKSCSEK